MSDRAEAKAKGRERGGGDGIYNIYVSSAIRRCLLASLRLRRRRRIMVTSGRRPRFVAWSVSLSETVSVSVIPRNECCNQTENEEGRKEGTGGTEGVWRRLNDFIGRRRTAGRPRTGGRNDATRRLPHLLPEEDDERPTRLGGRNCARAYTYSIVLRAEETSRRVEGHRSPSSDFCIRGGRREHRREQKTLFGDKGRREESGQWP